MEEYIDAFTLLTSRRQSGFAVQPITLSEIWVYIDRHSVTDSEYFVELIILMDNTYLGLVNNPKEKSVFNRKDKDSSNGLKVKSNH